MRLSSIILTLCFCLCTHLKAADSLVTFIDKLATSWEAQEHIPPRFYEESIAKVREELVIALGDLTTSPPEEKIALADALVKLDTVGRRLQIPDAYLAPIRLASTKLCESILLTNWLSDKIPPFFSRALFLQAANNEDYRIAPVAFRGTMTKLFSHLKSFPKREYVEFIQKLIREELPTLFTSDKRAGAIIDAIDHLFALNSDDLREKIEILDGISRKLQELDKDGANFPESRKLLDELRITAKKSLFTLRRTTMGRARETLNWLSDCAFGLLSTR